MVYKLCHLSINKDKEQLRMFLCNLVSQVNIYTYIDNPCAPNKFENNDLKVKYTRSRGKKKNYVEKKFMA
jgi:hypothetical protein